MRKDKTGTAGLCQISETATAKGLLPELHAEPHAQNSKLIIKMNMEIL